MIDEESLEKSATFQIRLTCVENEELTIHKPKCTVRILDRNSAGLLGLCRWIMVRRASRAVLWSHAFSVADAVSHCHTLSLSLTLSFSLSDAVSHCHTLSLSLTLSFSLSDAVLHGHMLSLSLTLSCTVTRFLCRYLFGCLMLSRATSMSRYLCFCVTDVLWCSVRLATPFSVFSATSSACLAL